MKCIISCLIYHKVKKKDYMHWSMFEKGGGVDISGQSLRGTACVRRPVSINMELLSEMSPHYDSFQLHAYTCTYNYMCNIRMSPWDKQAYCQTALPSSLLYICIMRKYNAYSQEGFWFGILGSWFTIRPELWMTQPADPLTQNGPKKYNFHVYMICCNNVHHVINSDTSKYTHRSLWKCPQWKEECDLSLPCI